MRTISLIKMLPFLLLTFLTAVICTVPVRGQSGEAVHGTVHTVTCDPLVGVSVMIQGEKEGTLTDERGNFSLRVKTGTLLVITHVGYNKKEVEARDGMEVVLVTNTSDLSQVLVVGYGSQSRKKITGAVSTINGDDIKNTVVIKTVGRTII